MQRAGRAVRELTSARPAGCACGRPSPPRRACRARAAGRAGPARGRPTASRPISRNASGIPPARCAESRSPVEAACGVVRGQGLLGPHVDRRPQPPLGDDAHERVEVDHARAAHEQQHRAVRHQPQLALAEEPGVVARRRREHEDDARAAQQLVQARRLGVRAPDRELGQPRVVDEDRAAERHEHAAQRTAEVAEPDDADRAAGEQEGAGVRVEPPLLAARAHGPVGGADPAREIDRHAERRLGDGHRERRAGAEDVDAALARDRVVDVGQEVALDVDHRPQLRGAGEPLRRQVGLAEDRDRLGQVRLDRRGGHRLGVAHDEPPERFEPGARRRVADHVERPRQRVDEDERLRHAPHPLNPRRAGGRAGSPAAARAA